VRGELFEQVRSARVFVGLTVFLGLLVAVATIAQMAFLSRIVDRVLVSGEGLGGVRALMTLLLGAMVARALLLWVREVAAQRGAVRVKSELRERLFAHVLWLGPSYTGGERAGELATTATGGVEKLGPYFARYLPQAALSAFIPLLVALYILPRDLSSAVLLLVTAPVIPVMMVLVGSYAEDHMKRQWTALSRLGARFLGALRGLTTLKIFGRAADEERRVAEASEEFRERTMKVLRYAFLSGLVLEFMTGVAIALVAVTLGVRLINGAISFEEAFLVLLLAPEFYKPLRELGAHRHAGMEGKAAAERIFEILDTPAPVKRDAGAAPGLRPAGRRSGGMTVEFSGVSYAYPGREEPALSEVDLLLRAGMRTALVGRSGSGKSTLVNLLLRFVDPTGGRVLANGVDIGDLPVEAWREHVALVPQRPYLFYGSVLENIRLARPRASREEVRWAATRAGADEFVGQLPAGYDAQIGERGTRLSGGEAQRVAVARAFLKDAPLLVMDEPTSSLDPESEGLIRDAIESLAEDRTVLVVAHRLNTVRNADVIAVLEGGNILEVGTHTGLVERGGPYSRIVGARDVAKDGALGQARA
jgi:ATP-binding cassette subfamily C protein CydD